MPSDLLAWRSGLRCSPTELPPFSPREASGEVEHWDVSDQFRLPGFRDLGECGRGGMGVVRLAEQEGLGRQVAIKFLRSELAGSESQRIRFRGEAKALARLRHPNVVQVYEAGDHRGRCYIVQEFVGGGGLDRRLAGQPLGYREAAALVAELAGAVQHAHDLRIVHRDLKPSNVLMAEDGRPKIVDFGLAKYLDQDGTGGRTQSGDVIGSPSYMAPEQVAGPADAVGPAADVYALGAILYQALTGRPPFLSSSVLETLDQVRSTDCVPPRQLRPGLPRDLETVCLKCLEKSPQRRYATAAGLSEDLNRFLEGRPVVARPTGNLEKLVKWLRRHPGTAAALGVAGLAAVVLVVGGLTYQSLLRAALQRAKMSASLAQANERRANDRYRAASKTLQQMLDRLNDRRFVEIPRLRELLMLQLGDAQKFYGDIVGEGADTDPVKRFECAQATIRLATVQYQLDQTDAARRSVLSAIKLIEPLATANPDRADYQEALAIAYRRRSQIGEVVDPSATPAERSAGSVASLDRAAGILTRLIADDPTHESYRLELAGTSHDLGAVYFNAGDPAKAGDAFRRAVKYYETLLDPAPTRRDATTRLYLAKTYRNLAVVRQGERDHVGAMKAYESSRNLLLGVVAIDPDNHEATLALAGTLFNWAIYRSSDPSSDALVESLFEEAIGRLTPVLKREPQWAIARTELRSSHGGRAQWHDLRGRFDMATADWEKVVELSEPSEKDHYRFFLALAKARAGDHKGAWELVKTLTPVLKEKPVVYEDHLVAVCGVAAQKAAEDRAISLSERELLSTMYAKEGVRLFLEALARGSGTERPERIRNLREDKDFVLLAKHPAASALLGDVELPENVFSVSAPVLPGNK